MSLFRGASVRGASLALAALFVLVYWMTLVGLGADSRMVVGTVFATILAVTVLALVKRPEGVRLGRYTTPLYAMAVVSLLYLTHLENLPTFVNFVNYFVPAFYFVMFMVLFRHLTVNKDISRFFKLVFIVETAFILIEVFDGLFGFDVHGTWVTRFFLERDDRFLNIDVLGTGYERIDELPIALGLHGFPHYTAPIYVASFAFAIAHASSPLHRGQRMTEARKRKAAVVFFSGVFCIYMLGVKTHFVTAVLMVLVVAFALRRKLLAYAAVAGILLTVGTLMSPWAMERIRNLNYQTFVGNETEGSRIEVIFRFSEYRAVLDLSVWEVIVGKGEFKYLVDFDKRGYFLEQRWLQYMIVFGVPYVVLILGFYGMGLRSCWRVYWGSGDAKARANAVGIACALMVFLADIGHFGYSMITPNIQLLFVMLAAIAVIEHGVEIEQTARLAAPRELRSVYRRSADAPVAVPQVVLNNRVP